MNIFLYSLAVGLTVFLTFAFFRLFGAQTHNIFLSPNEKLSWDSKIKGTLKRLLTISNVFGAITSIATLLFLAGSAKLFGVFAFFTGITIALSGFVTNPITKKLFDDASIKNRYKDKDQVGGVIASLFWKNNAYDKLLSKIVQYVSLFGIFSIIWLEISLFTDFSSAYLGIDNPINKTVIAFLTFLTIFYFVVRYGLRGFVFADLLHSPLIILMGLALVAILLYLFLGGAYELSLETFVIPALPWEMAVVFALHVLVLNLFQITCTEPHWFRLWLFDKVEISSQKESVVGTGAVWLVLLFIGFSTFALTGEIGDGAIGSLLSKVSLTTPIFLFLFWIAAVGAIFSTVDTQLYSILLVWSFNVSKGTLPRDSKRFDNPFTISVFISVIYALIYFLVKFYDIQFEKILLVVVPFSIVLLPLFIAKYFNRKPSISILTLSVLGYTATASIGFILDELNFYATLSAVFVPLIVSVLTFFSKKTSTDSIQSK